MQEDGSLRVVLPKLLVNALDHARCHMVQEGSGDVHEQKIGHLGGRLCGLCSYRTNLVEGDCGHEGIQPAEGVTRGEVGHVSNIEMNQRLHCL